MTIAQKEEITELKTVSVIHPNLKQNQKGERSRPAETPSHTLTKCDQSARQEDSQAEEAQGQAGTRSKSKRLREPGERGRQKEEQNHGAQAQRQEKTSEQLKKNRTSHQRNKKEGQPAPSSETTEQGCSSLCRCSEVYVREKTSPEEGRETFPGPQARELNVGSDLRCGSATTVGSRAPTQQRGGVLGQGLNGSQPKTLVSERSERELKRQDSGTLRG